MKEPKLTPWFPASVKPVREGVYERDGIKVSGPGFSYWDAKKGWRFTACSPEGAADIRELRSLHQCAPWRGLAEKPQ